MNALATKFQSIDEYIATFPKDIQAILEKLRKIVKEVAPEVEEKISYGMPSFKLHGYVVHFAAYKHHIGFYPIPTGIQAFQKELASYITGKGTVQFPLDKPIPYTLVKQIVKYRVQENLEKYKS